MLSKLWEIKIINSAAQISGRNSQITSSPTKMEPGESISAVKAQNQAEYYFSNDY